MIIHMIIHDHHETTTTTSAANDRKFIIYALESFQINTQFIATGMALQICHRLSLNYPNSPVAIAIWEAMDAIIRAHPNPRNMEEKLHIVLELTFAIININSQH